MSYVTHNFETGDVLYASDLNEMDAQIEAISNVVTPQQFNAKGDGTTDDTLALTSAFNRSNAVIEGGNFSYKIEELVITEQNNLVIRNFRFYHGISITLKHCQNVCFENCIWDEFSDNGIIDKTVHCVILTTIHVGADEWIESNNYRINEVCKNIKFNNCQFIGTHFTESTPSLYENTKPHYNTGMCLRLDGVDGLYVDNCYFTQNRGNACIQSNSYAPLGDFKFTNNFFYLNCWGGIELYRYTGISSHPTRIIQGNRFIGHGLGYLPWSYLELFPEKERGVGTAVLLGGSVARIKNEPAFCAVLDNIFEDNNESSIEGWQWNPIKNNVIVGNGVLQSNESVTEMTQKYKITYQLYVRKNPSQNPIYMGQYAHETEWYPAGEIRSIENNTISRGYGTLNPVIVRGDYYEQVIIRNNTMTDEALYDDPNAKFWHFLKANFHNGLVWENNIGLRPYFNDCDLTGGTFALDELYGWYNCRVSSSVFEDLSKTDRFQSLKSARVSDEFAEMRDNEVSVIVNGKPELGYKPKEQHIVIPDPVFDIKDEQGYSDGYTFGGASSPTIVDTQLSLGATDTGWTIFVDTTTTGDNGAGNHSFLIRLMTFSDASENITMQIGSRWTADAWTFIWNNGDYYGDNTGRIDGSTAQNFLATGKSSRFILRHKQSSGKIEVYAVRYESTPTALSEIYRGSYDFTSGVAGTLRFGGSILNSSRDKSYYCGVMKEAQAFDRALNDAQISMLLVGEDISTHPLPIPVYDISNNPSYVEGTGLTMDGTFAIDTGIALLEDTNDFTITTKFKFDDMTAESALPNFTFIPVFSAMSAEMPINAHTGHTDKGFDVGLSLQDGTDMEVTAIGGFIDFRRDWRYVNSVMIDSKNYHEYFNKYYIVIVQRKDGIIKLYDENLLELVALTGDYGTAIVNGNLTIGAKMGYGSSYTDFFKGVIESFKVYNYAVDLHDIEKEFPSLYDNDASYKGAVKYYLANKCYTRKTGRYVVAEISYDLGEFNDDQYTTTYPQAFGVKMDGVYDDVEWIPCSAEKKIIIERLCKWSSIYNPYESWGMEIVNPGTVPGMTVKINGIKALLLSGEEEIANTVSATDFEILWKRDLDQLNVGGRIEGYAEYYPEDATTGTSLTVSSEDTSIATVSVEHSRVRINGISVGDTLIHVSIPYGTEKIYSVTVSSD